MNEHLVQDFAEIPAAYWGGLCGKRIVVSGATGFIGSLFVRFLHHLNSEKKANIRIVALVRDIERARSMFEGVPMEFVTIDLASSLDLEIAGIVDVVVHGAAVTASASMVAYPVDVVRTALNGTDKLLRFAVGKSARFVLLSSMEVYGAVGTDRARSEDDLGYIDPKSVRSCYPESKRMCELLCKAYAHQFSADVVVARLAMTFGAGASAKDNRVAMQFARSAVSGVDIVLRTPGLSTLNTVYASDAIGALALISTKGLAGETYNVVNENSRVTVLGLAQEFARQVSAGRSRVVVRPVSMKVTGYAPDTILRISAKRVTDLGWVPKVPLEEACRRTGAYVRDLQAISLDLGPSVKS